MSKAKHIYPRSMSRWARHKRKQYNVGKPFQRWKHNKESFLNNEYQVHVIQDEPKRRSSLKSPHWDVCQFQDTYQPTNLKATLAMPYFKIDAFSTSCQDENVTMHIH